MNPFKVGDKVKLKQNKINDHILKTLPLKYSDIFEIVERGRKLVWIKNCPPTIEKWSFYTDRFELVEEEKQIKEQEYLLIYYGNKGLKTLFDLDINTIISVLNQDKPKMNDICLYKKYRSGEYSYMFRGLWPFVIKEVVYEIFEAKK